MDPSTESTMDMFSRAPGGNKPREDLKLIGTSLKKKNSNSQNKNKNRSTCT